jgi:uncharacterized protein YfaP (DUF2135 family)
MNFKLPKLRRVCACFGLGILALPALEVSASPNCDNAFAIPSVLDPANDQFVPITIGGLGSPQPTVTYTCVTQTEPKSYSEGLDTITDDAVGFETGDLALRARRLSTFVSPETGEPLRSNGRLYHVDFQAMDSSGQECTGSITIEAPLYKGSNSNPDAATVDFGFRFISTSAEGNCDVSPPPDDTTIAITSISDGDTTTSAALVLSGSISAPNENSVIVADSMPGDIEPNGNFSIGPLFLNPGVNNIEVKLYDKVSQQLVAAKAITVNYSSSSDASMTVGPEGGELKVDDPTSPIHGAGITLPEGAISQDTTFDITQDLEHLPMLPFEWVDIGPAVSFQPFSLMFATPVSLTLPIVPNSLSSGETPKVLLLGDDGWQVVDVTAQTETSVTVAVSGMVFGQAIAVKQRPLAAGQTMVITSPAYASIYINGVSSGLRTPAVIDGVQAAESELKLYLEGFNEHFDVISASDGALKRVTLSKTDLSEAPVVVLNQRMAPEFSTTEADLTLSGLVIYQDVPLADAPVIFSLNGKDYFERTDSSGSFDGAVVLSRGENKLQIRSTAPNGQTYVSETYLIHLGSPDLTATLSWNTNNTDIDLHIFSPSNQHASYQNMMAIPGGAIDRDDTNGFGPEIFTLHDPLPGVYRFNVDSYRIDGLATTAVLQVRLGNSEVFNQSYTFTSEDGNAGNGSNGSASTFWLAAKVEVGELFISSVRFQEASQPDDAIFTTQNSENQITVNIDAPDEVPDQEISLTVTETNDDTDIDVSTLTGRSIIWEATHNLPTDLTVASDQIRYEVKAISDAFELESTPITITQERKSQLRQEYIDKAALKSNFERATPDRDDIINAGEYTPQPDFTFAELAAFSDFGPGLAIIGESDDIAQTMRNAWGNPIRITSGYRNPRRNDRLGASSINSFHQTGDAIDLNPSFNRNNWPMSVVCDPDLPQFTTITIAQYSDAQDALTCLAHLQFGTDYDILFHANHLHIELDP